MAGQRSGPLKEPGHLLRPRKAHSIHFSDDGETPNNARFPLIHYRSPVVLRGRDDPAQIFEELFAAHGWKKSWRDSIYTFNHFHTHRHEVLGIARGKAKVRFGGGAGRTLDLHAGDVVVIPAGTGHRRVAGSEDLLVVGAYPDGGKYDQPRPDKVDHGRVLAAIAKVGAPKSDPVYGARGPLTLLWHPRP